MTGLAEVDGLIICIQVCMWLGFPPLTTQEGISVECQPPTFRAL